MKAKYKHIQRHFSFAIIVASVVIGSCAKIGSPSGGPKDVDPPIVVSSTPNNGSVDFQGKKFTVVFDEYLNIDEVGEKLMVSPPLSKKPSVSMKGKSIVVEFQDELKDSTTYTFYFQDAIKDLNENNPIENFQYVFSTGKVLDSLSVEGMVIATPILAPTENVYVYLYKNLNDTAFKKILPDYMAKVSADGSFRIDNVREGEYNMYALVDQDNNKMYNIEDESIAFLNSTIKVSPETNYLPVAKQEQKADSLIVADSLSVSDTDKDKIKLYLFTPEKSRYYLTSSSRKSATELMFTTSMPSDNFDFDFTLPGGNDDDYVIVMNATRDTMNVWLLDTAFSNQQLLRPIINYPFTDDLIGAVVQKRDTVNMRYVASRINTRRSSATEKNPSLAVDGNFLTRNISPLLKFRLKSTTPFVFVDEALIHFYEKADSLRKPVPFEVSIDTLNPTIINVSASLNKGVDYMFVADSSAMRDIYGIVSDSIGGTLSIATDDNFGKLTFRISGYDGPRIIQLLSVDEEVKREFYFEKDGELSIPYIERGTYRIRVIYDLNGDGKWTPGDYYSKRQPEPVSYYPTEIEIKANWDQIFDWDISEQNVKAFSSGRNNSSGDKTNSPNRPNLR